MKNLKDIIIEKLNIKNINICKPKTKEELKEILEERLAKDKDANLNDIDVSDITDMSSLFYNLDPRNIDISEWNVSNVTNMFGMFSACKNFNSDLSNWNVSNVQNMVNMFYECEKFKGKGLEKWKTTKLLTYKNIFFKTQLEKNPPKWYK